MHLSLPLQRFQRWLETAPERLSHLLLVQDSWTVGSVCMTPTMKIRRNVLEARYAERVASLPAQPALHWENRT